MYNHKSNHNSNHMSIFHRLAVMAARKKIHLLSLG